MGAADERDDVRLTKSAQIDFVIGSLGEGIRALRGLQGRQYRPISMAVEARRKAAGKMLRAVDGQAWIAARNVPLSPHHRGENDRGTEYLNLTPEVRDNPEKFIDLCPSEDFEDFESTLRQAVAPPDTEPESHWPRLN